MVGEHKKFMNYLMIKRAQCYDTARSVFDTVAVGEDIAFCRLNVPSRELSEGVRHCSCLLALVQAVFVNSPIFREGR